MKKKINKKRDLIITFVSIVALVIVMLLAYIGVTRHSVDKEIIKEKKESVQTDITESQETFNQKEEFYEQVEIADQQNRYEFDEERLKLEGSVEYEGPDFETGSMEFDTYTGLKIKNLSDKFLRTARINLELSNGEIMSIVVDSLPPGKTVFTLGREYKGFSALDTYKVQSCTTEYEEQPVCSVEGLNISCEGMKINILNNTEEDFSGYTFFYKGKEENLLMSGITYSFKVDSLKAGCECNIDRQDLIGSEIEIVEIKK